MNLTWTSTGSSVTDTKGSTQQAKRMQGQAHSEFTAKDSVTPASVFLQTPAVGLCHLHGAAVPLVLQSVNQTKKERKMHNPMNDA